MIVSSSEDNAGEDTFDVRAATSGSYVCGYYNGSEYVLESKYGQELDPPLDVGEFRFHSSAEFVDLKTALQAARAYWEGEQ